jgi:3-phenylpropionate/cinnamic acid dioxygenase small subunit
MSTSEPVAATIASPEVHAELSAFLAFEAEALDSRRFADWVELVDEQFTYRVPVPITPDNPAAPAYDEHAFIVDESRETLIEHWFVRYEPEMWEIAWSENPPVRFRHFVTNVRVRETEQPDVLDVRSNAIVTAARQSSATTTLHVERFDLVRRGPAGLRLMRRFAVVDEALLDFSQLRVVL